MENPGSLNEKLDGWAMWVGETVASAFFASLERFSCVNVATTESDDEDEEEAKDYPLMFTNHEITADHGKDCCSVDDLPV